MYFVRKSPKRLNLAGIKREHAPVEESLEKHNLATKIVETLLKWDKAATRPKIKTPFLSAIRLKRAQFSGKHGNSAILFSFLILLVDCLSHLTQLNLCVDFLHMTPLSQLSYFLHFVQFNCFRFLQFFFSLTVLASLTFLTS